MKSYIYYISYFYTRKKDTNGFGVGDVEATRSKPIKTMYDIAKIREAIKEANPSIDGITVLNFTLLREEDAEA